MSQTSYSLNTINAFAGQLADIGPKTVRSYAAAEAIPFGMGLMQDRGSAGQCRLPFVGQVVLTESTAQVASNSTSGTVNVTTLADGVPTTVSTNLSATAFITDDPTTLAAIAAKIAAVVGVKSAMPGNGNITVVANPDTSVTLSNFVTTGGAGQPAWSCADRSADLFLGISIFEQTIENDLNTGTAQYPVNKEVNVLSRGTVFVAVETAIKPGDPIFVRFAAGANGTQPGAFGNTDDSSTCVQVSRARWLDQIAAGAVGKLEVSLP